MSDLSHLSKCFRIDTPCEQFSCHHGLDTLGIPYNVLVFYDKELLPTPEHYVLEHDTVRVLVDDKRCISLYSILVIPYEGKPKEYDVICDSSNNSDEDSAAGRLNVDLVFYGSLAQHVRDSLDRLASDGAEKDQHNRT